MITKDILEEFKLTPKHLKPKFTAKQPSDKTARLINLVRDRIKEGRSRNLRDYRWWWAMDLAYDAPFRNTTQTIMASFMDSIANHPLKGREALNKAKDWGLGGFVAEEKCDDGTTRYKINTPVMFKVVIPLVRSYLNIRVARLWAERDILPFLKYEPIISTTRNQVRCEILTNAIEMQAQQFGYRSIGRQWIFNALHYGTTLMFPAEDWYVEKEDTLIEKPEKEGAFDRKTVIRKEGLRYNIPHPSRVFYDQAHRIGTINSDTGVEYAGYWRVARYGNVKDNELYWNTDKVSMFRNDIIGQNAVFFRELYPCTMELGVMDNIARTGAGQMDRESQVSFYSTSDVDKAVFLTDIFMKIRPSQYGLGDYDHPVWFRFIAANDDDILYAAPLCYTPPLYIGYDAHEERGPVASLSMEICPFQDHMSNLLTQQILTAKQNLAKAIFVDTDLVPQRFVDELRNLGENLYREYTFIPFSGRKRAMEMKSIQHAFTHVSMPHASIMELMSTFRLLLDMLERVLVFSSQELAATAPHVQTAEEVRTIGGSVTTRTQFTNAFIDDGWYAWKNQLYTAKMAYGSEEVWSHVPAMPPVTKQILSDLGFALDEEGTPGKSSHKIHGPKRALSLEGFSSVREGYDRINNPELAIGMAQVVQVLLSNPITAEALGPEQAIELYNQMLRLSGLPRDFRLRNAMGEGGMGMKPEEMQEILRELSVQILERAAEQSMQITNDAVTPLAEGLQQMDNAVTDIATQLPPMREAIGHLIERMDMLMEMASQDARQQTAPDVTGGPQIGPPDTVGRI